MSYHSSRFPTVSSPMLRCLIGHYTPDAKTNAAAPDRLSLGRPHLPWCGRPCCRPWQDAPPDVRPSGQPAAAFHLPSDALHHILSRLDAEISNAIHLGTLTLLPDNHLTLPSAAPAQGSLTLRSPDSPNHPTAIPTARRRPVQGACSEHLPQPHTLTCVQPQLGRRTRSSVWAGPLLLATSNQPPTNH